MIESIFNLLTENPFIFVILIGVISTLFGRDKETKKEQKPPQQRPHRAPTNQAEREKEQRNMSTLERTKKMLEDASAKKVKEVVSSSKVKAHEVESELSREYDNYLQKRSMLENQAAEMEIQVTSIKQAARNTKQVHELKAFSKNKLVDGIIMSEILGPPRAKKPFYRR